MRRPALFPGDCWFSAPCPQPDAAAPRYFRAIAGPSGCPRPGAAAPRYFRATVGSGPVSATLCGGPALVPGDRWFRTCVRDRVRRTRVVPGRSRVQALGPRPDAADPLFFRAMRAQGLCPQSDAAAPRQYRAIAGSGPVVLGLVRRPRDLSGRSAVYNPLSAAQCGGGPAFSPGDCGGVQTRRMRWAISAAPSCGGGGSRGRPTRACSRLFSQLPAYKSSASMRAKDVYFPMASSNR
jgi:hypothetical protein